MKPRTFIFIILALFISSIFGCTATISLENAYDIRIINKTGETVRISLDDGSYRYVENECILIISSVDGGYHEMKWEWDAPRGRTRTKQSYTFTIDADLEIVIQDDSDDFIVIIEY